MGAIALPEDSKTNKGCATGGRGQPERLVMLQSQDGPLRCGREQQPTPQGLTAACVWVNLKGSAAGGFCNDCALTWPAPLGCEVYDGT